MEDAGRDLFIRVLRDALFALAIFQVSTRNVDRHDNSESGEKKVSFREH